MPIGHCNVVHALTLPLLAIAVWLSGAALSSPEPVVIEGVTMGTTYHVTYFDDQKRDLKAPVDSLLQLVNRSINAYDPASEVSAFNTSKKGIALRLPYLYDPLKKSLEVAAATQGAFDPTVMPLVNAWGFGPEKQNLPDARRIDSLRAFVGYKKIRLSRDSIKKYDARVQLDFGGIGQGYGADVIARFLRSKGIVNFLVELGGEGVASGKNLRRNAYWKIGVLDPNSTRDNQYFKAYVSLNNRSFTTAGNYFNYREVNGIKYGHTIDPRTGSPVQHTLLSASVFAKDCATADAWDTAFMVLGLEASIALLKVHPDLEALLLFSAPDGKTGVYVTPGFTEFIDIEP
jgi:FAD:protein FMN transferase